VALPNPVSPAAGQSIDKTFWDNEVYERAVDLAAPWVDYTPVWTASGGTPNVGSGGERVGKYKLIGKTVFFYIRLTLGSSPNVSGSQWFITLPPFAPLYSHVGYARALNASPIQLFSLTVAVSVAGTVTFYGPNGSPVTSSNPFTWTSAVGASLHVSGFYEIA
jgi:hypothetical protein